MITTVLNIIMMIVIIIGINNNKKETKKKKARSKSCVHLMCDKQVLLDYNIIFQPVWNSVNNTK
jgi:hypothetical protein